MAEAAKVLGQSAPLVTTLTDAYAVPGSTTAVVSTVLVCNRSVTATSFRIAVSPAAAAIANQHYLYFDVPILGNDTFAATLGLALGAADIVRVYAGAATLSFSLFGVEITA